MTRAFAAVLLLLPVAPPLAHAATPGTRSADRGVTWEGPSLPGTPRPETHGVFCEGINYANDDYFDNGSMGGPVVGFVWTPASSLTIERVEIFTGELAGTSRVAIWSDTGGPPSQPLAALGFSDPFLTDLPNTWYGADLLTPVDVVAGTRYWVVWDPQGGEQVSATDDAADIQNTYWGSFSGTVEGGTSWEGPWNFPDRRWKARTTCRAPCESPSMATAVAADVDDCNDGVVLSWDPATFPGPGNGSYHVYRSALGFADALTQPALALDVPGTTWIDDTTSPGATYWYVVQAESLDFPACGAGPLVAGSTSEVDTGPVADVADLVPPAGDIGGTLRATGHGAASVDFAWTLAPLPLSDELYVVFRSDNRADAGFVDMARTPARQWTDNAVPPRPEPVHVWYYYVRFVDTCGNLSPD